MINERSKSQHERKQRFLFHSFPSNQTINLSQAQTDKRGGRALKLKYLGEIEVEEEGFLGIRNLNPVFLLNYSRLSKTQFLHSLQGLCNDNGFHLSLTTFSFSLSRSGCGKKMAGRLQWVC